jgi:hypothetical protein
MMYMHQVEGWSGEGCNGAGKYELVGNSHESRRVEETSGDQDGLWVVEPKTMMMKQRVINTHLRSPAIGLSFLLAVANSTVPAEVICHALYIYTVCLRFPRLPDTRSGVYCACRVSLMFSPHAFHWWYNFLKPARSLSYYAPVLSRRLLLRLFKMHVLFLLVLLKSFSML